MTRRALSRGAALCAALAAALPAAAQFQAPRPSPKASVSQTIGLTDVGVSYSRPSVKGRVIWGGLVPYDKPWRTGANEATTITFSDDVTVNGQKLAAGTYSIVTFPGKTEWTVAFNKDTKLWWETEYDAAKDALRVKVAPQEAAHKETFEISFPAVGADSAQLAFHWEKVYVPVFVGTETKAKAMELAKKEVEKASAEAWRTPLRAARWAWESKASLDDAAAWADRSIAVQENWSYLSLKARILADQGKTKEAIATGEKAVQVARASAQKPDT
ncbi:DUF2911 domain-containing protein, partial [Acidobacteria bacterium ACD]|nr:DUF2911 domain-containing protein [Acidobacteria bacterium ACD]